VAYVFADRVESMVCPESAFRRVFAGRLARAIYDENETSLSPTRFLESFSPVLGRLGTPSLAAMAEDSGRWWIARQAM